MTAAQKTAAQILLAYKYVSPRHQGRCRELESLRAQIANGGRDWQPDYVHTKGISDPTQVAAVAIVCDVPRLTQRANDLEDEIARVARTVRLEDSTLVQLVAAAVERDLLDDYYLTADEVTWSDVAAWHGISLRTVFVRSRAALDALDDRRLLA